MCPKKTRGNIKKSSSARKTLNKSKNSKREAKENTKKTVQKTRNLGSTTLHQRKNVPQAVKKKSTKLTKTAKNSSEKRLSNQKNELDKKKKQTEISTKRNMKQPRLLQKKKNLKSISSTEKTRSKTVRNTKKSTPEPLIDEINKNGGRRVTEISSSIPSSTATRAEINKNRRFAPQVTQTSIIPYVPSSSVTQEMATGVFRGALQSNISPLERSRIVDTRASPGTLQWNKPRLVHSHITDTGFSRGALQPTKSPSVPGVRVITPSTAVSPASVVHDEPSACRSSNTTGFNRNLEPSKILDMAEVHDNLYFLMKWKGSSVIDLIPVKIANQRCPQVVIQFYESRLRNVFMSSN